MTRKMKMKQEEPLTGVLSVLFEKEQILSMSIPEGEFKNEFTCQVNGQKFRLLVELVK